ncbi:MAG: hypothetical protein KatS3mg057_1027 [Herpetosiphonaceae bacterium]|nr:MAG: hypothetical protein KatS3mg057_1027 [Herpetosiphonaceae bacterium]
MTRFGCLRRSIGCQRNVFRCSLRELVEMLEIEPLLPKLLRNLSLGERMKCELAAALLHEPRVCFLDEPTLGLDVTIQMRLRRFLADYNKRNDATMIITSHYMADVTTLCPRVILIDKGRLFYDGDLPGLAAKIAPFKLVRLAVEEGVAEELSQLIPGFGSAVELIRARWTAFYIAR